MSTTATPIVKRYCKRKQTMCEYENELAYCKVTACVYRNSFPKTYTSNRTDAEPSKVDYRTDESANIGTEVNDLISRADAICEILVNDGIDNIVDRINALPSADSPLPRYVMLTENSTIESIRPQGEWIEVYDFIHKAWKCSKCGHITSIQHNYCPNCGARMRGGAE